MDLKICCIKECDAPSEILGLCHLHWKRVKKYGSPVAVKSHSGSFQGKTAEERFLMQVNKTDSCWWWIGGKDKNGYGMFRGEVGATMFTRAHRFSYAFHTGDLLVGMVAMHSCDNPSCVNPAHLSSGTNADNQRDKMAKGRHRGGKGERHGGVLLTESQAQAILTDPRPYTELAAEYGVAPSTIGSIKQRVSWKELDGEAAKWPRKGIQTRNKLTADDVRFIRTSADRNCDLAVKFGVTRATITDIKKRRSWAELSS